jgi:hypothetical protein
MFACRQMYKQNNRSEIFISENIPNSQPCLPNNIIGQSVLVLHRPEVHLVMIDYKEFLFHSEKRRLF